MKYKITNIHYDTDGEVIEGLPQEFIVSEEEADEFFTPADYVSDNTGFCVFSCDVEEIE